MGDEFAPNLKSNEEATDTANRGSLSEKFGALSMLDHLAQVAFEHVGKLGDLRIDLVVEASGLQLLLQFTDEVDAERREIVDEIERVLDFVGDPGGQLAERGELLGLDQAVLRGPQFLQRFREIARARLNAVEQARRRFVLCRRSSAQGQPCADPIADRPLSSHEFRRCTQASYDHAARSGRRN